jgi:xmnI restriction endonuclease
MLNYTLGTIEASEALIKDLYIDLRAKVNAWSKITQQTPQARMGYVGQHLVSVVTGYPGGKSGARGYDLVIDDERHGEIKTCYRVDQLGSCNACGAVVSSLETECAVCRSTSINRKDDSKWLIAIRNNDEFAKLLDPYRYYFVLFEFESIYDSNNNDIIASIWEVDPKSKGFAYCMIDYYLNIRSQSTSKAPFNMWPHMLKFALTEPTLIYRSKITNDGNIITDVFPSKNNTYSDVLLPLSSYSGSTTISVANIKNVIKKYSPSARVNGLNKEKLLQLLEDIRKTNNITNADLCNKFADEIYLPKAVLDQKQRILLEHINEHPEIMVTWFQPDEKKDGGQYITTTGRLKRFDESACMLLLKDGSNIPISHIIGLESAYFEGLF